MKRSAILFFVILMLAAAVWYSFYNTSFTHLLLNDAMDYASIGRNVSRGDGFISSYITPLGLAAREGLPHPDLWRAPLWPWLLSMFIGLLGATDQAVAIATGCFFILGAGLVFLLGREMFGRTVGFLSAVIFIFSSQNLANSVSGMTETLAVFMMLLSVYLVVRRRAQTAWGDILGGAVLGLFYLARYNALLFLPFFAFLVWYKRRESAGRQMFGRYHLRNREGPGAWPVVRYLAAFMVVISPWLIRNYLLMGSPLYSLQKFEPAMFTATYPVYSLYMRPELIDVAAFVRTHPWEIWAKVAGGWSEFLTGLFNPANTGVSPYLFGLFLVSLILPLAYSAGRTAEEMQHKGVRLQLAACFVTQLAALLVIHFIYRLFYIFMPFYIIFGTAAIVWLLTRLAERLPVKKNGFIIVFAAALTGLFIATNLPVWNPVNQENIPINVLRESVKGVTDMSTRQELIISNDGHLLAWYGDRYAAKLPYSVDMLPEMEKLASLKFIYLSSRISWNLPEADKSWAKVFWSKPKEVYGFKLAVVYPDGSVVYRKN